MYSYRVPIRHLIIYRCIIFFFIGFDNESVMYISVQSYRLDVLKVQIRQKELLNNESLIMSVLNFYVRKTD